MLFCAAACASGSPPPSRRGPYPNDMSVQRPHVAEPEVVRAAVGWLDRGEPLALAKREGRRVLPQGAHKRQFLTQPLPLGRGVHPLLAIQLPLGREGLVIPPRFAGDHLPLAIAGL